MAYTKLSMREARARLTQLPEELGDDEQAAAVVTRNNEPALAILRFSAFVHLLQQLDSLLETIEVMQDASALAAIKASEEDIKAGRVVPWEQVKQELGLDG